MTTPDTPHDLHRHPAEDSHLQPSDDPHVFDSKLDMTSLLKPIHAPVFEYSGHDFEFKKDGWYKKPLGLFTLAVVASVVGGLSLWGVRLLLHYSTGLPI